MTVRLARTADIRPGGQPRAVTGDAAAYRCVMRTSPAVPAGPTLAEALEAEATTVVDLALLERLHSDLVRL